MLFLVSAMLLLSGCASIGPQLDVYQAGASEESNWLCRSSDRFRGQSPHGVTLVACVLRLDLRCQSIISPECTGECLVAFGQVNDACLHKWSYGDKSVIHLQEQPK